MPTPHLIYFADPMCSWCYGFSPVLDDIRRAFGRTLPIRVVMGGLRPGTETPMTEAAKLEVAGHWRHVNDATGLPFDGAGMAREGFIYDTDPAARAVVVLRREGEELAAAYLSRVQRAFYAEGRDVTQGPVLADLVAELGVEPDRFLEQWGSEEAKAEPGATTPSPSGPASPVSRPSWRARTPRASMASSPVDSRRANRCWRC